MTTQIDLAEANDAANTHIGMTRLALFVLLASLSLLPLHATNFLLNGDFIDGVGHWYGDARTPQDFAQDNAQQAADPFYSKGVIIPLKDMSWSKFAQDFQGDIEGGIITVTYQLSPNLAFSEKPEKYQNVPYEINYSGWKPFQITPGKWMLFIADFGSSRGTYYPIKPKAGSGVQTIRCMAKNLTPHEDKTLTLAFPPGTGNVVILQVSVEGKGSKAPANDPDAIPQL